MTGQPQKTDSQYGDAMVSFMGDDPQYYCGIIIDPSAASFIQELRRRGFMVTAADNTVLDGIRKTSSLFARGLIKINRDQCPGLVNEIYSYVWDERAALIGEDKPVKEQDHGPDALRYKVNSLPSWRFNI